MASTVGRLKKVIADNLDPNHEPSSNARFSEAGPSSVQAIAFCKVVNGEFSLGLVADDCERFKTLQDLLAFGNARASAA